MNESSARPAWRRQGSKPWSPHHAERPAGPAGVESLEAAEELYRAIAEIVADWSYALSVRPDGGADVEWTDLDVSRVTGFPPGDLDVRRSWLSLVPIEDRSVLRHHLSALLAGRTDVAEYRIETRTGKTRWLRDYACPLRDAGDGTLNVVGGVRDVTARRQAEFDRARLISELEATNEELERIALSVSQELMEPLGAVASRLDDLDSRQHGPEELTRSVVAARDAVHHLLAMLARLDEFARIGHLPETLETIPLGELAAEAVGLCRDRIDGRRVQVEIGDLPDVFGDRIRLLQLLRLLVENAIDYMGDQSDPVLQIGSRRMAGKCVLYVRDNGAGIDPVDLERVFDVFRRLDPRSAGTGVGLALARRIAEMHGGRIRAESEGKGRGSTFVVELPA
jgi:PAS domain S-box-containing protein